MISLIKIAKKLRNFIKLAEYHGSHPGHPKHRHNNYWNALDNDHRDHHAAEKVPDWWKNLSPEAQDYYIKTHETHLMRTRDRINGKEAHEHSTKATQAYVGADKRTRTKLDDDLNELHNELSRNIVKTKTKKEKPFKIVPLKEKQKKQTKTRKEEELERKLTDAKKRLKKKKEQEKQEERKKERKNRNTIVRKKRIASLISLKSELEFFIRSHQGL